MPLTKQSLRRLSKKERERMLEENAEDLAAFETRAREPKLPFEKVLKDLKKRDLL